MFRPLVLKDGTYLYSEDTLLEYFNSLGFDSQDLKDFFQQDLKNECSRLEEIIDSFELRADNYFCNLRDMALEIEELCNKLRVGKGGTKKQMADKIMSVVNYYFEN